MKNLIITSILAVLVSAGTIVRGQDMPKEYLGLPGDNLNLYAVMKLFQDSKTLEEFERNLNSKDSMINNLDLNRDGFVDYITVTDYVDGKVHTIVLRAVLGSDEFQDVAVFIVERKNKNKVRIQLIGDEDLYGKNYIIEPNRETPNPGYNGDNLYVDNNTVVIIGDAYYYDLYDWPMIEYMFMYDYRPWHSSWYWGYWPSWYEPWSPWYWHYYYGYHYHWYPRYYEWYRNWDHPAHHYYNNFYYGAIRAHSAQVEHRIHEGTYRETYSRPEMRTEGENRYATMHVSDTRSTDGAITVARPSRRPAESHSTRTPSSVSENVPNRRTAPAVSTTTDNTVNETRTNDAGRRTSAPAKSSYEAPTRRIEEAPARSSYEAPARRTEEAPARSSYEAPARRTEEVPARTSYESPARRTEEATTRSSYEAPARSSYEAPARSSYEAPARRDPEPASIQRSEPARISASDPAPAARQSETRSLETRTSAPVEKSSNAEEAHRSLSTRR